MRNSFKTPLIVEVLPSGKRFKLHFAFSYFWKSGSELVRVKQGFETDFASIPRILRIIIPKLGRWNKAAVVHDWLYSADGRLWWVDREIADLIFLDAMADLGVAKWKRYVMYWGVRLGGWLAWRKRYQIGWIPTWLQEWEKESE